MTITDPFLLMLQAEIANLKERVAKLKELIEDLPFELDGLGDSEEL